MTTIASVTLQMAAHSCLSRGTKYLRGLNQGRKGEGRNAGGCGVGGGGGLWICRLLIRQCSPRIAGKWIMSTNKMFNPAPTANMTAVKYNIFHQTPSQVPNNDADIWWIRHSCWVMGTPQWSQRWVNCHNDRVLVTTGTVLWVSSEFV